MVHSKITWYKMFTPEHCAKITTEVHVAAARRQAHINAGQPSRSMEEMEDEEERNPTAMVGSREEEAPVPKEEMMVAYVAGGAADDIFTMQQVEEHFNRTLL